MIHKDTGIVEDGLRLFDALAQADPVGMLVGRYGQQRLGSDVVGIMAASGEVR